MTALIKTEGLILSLAFLLVPFFQKPVLARTFADFSANPPIHIQKFSQTPAGLSPDQIKAVYNLPKTGGSGTIAIIAAYNSATIENDLNVFSRQFGLPLCTISNGCLEIHPISSGIKSDNGWAGETALDTQWSHAIAPTAKILVVQAVTPSGGNLISAIDYARKRPDVVSISMSWGGGEFNSESSYDSHFQSSTGASFFASSGDNGTGVEWPAASGSVIAVGGTTLHFKTDGSFSTETAWNGSGGGVSGYISEPIFQSNFGILKLSGKRAVPDVSYDGDPNSGFSVYRGTWMVVGGTSAGAPQWAAMKALNKNIFSQNLYADASLKYSQYFRDVSKGSNGSCSFFCSAKKRYDTVTGLGSPLTINF